MLSPLPASAWDRGTAAHLALRAGFGAGPDERNRLAEAGLDGAVERFLSPVPEETVALAAALGHELQRCRYQLRPFLRTVFSSARFYTSTVRGHQIKSPVQWIAQTCRSLGAEVPPALVLENAFRRLGQIPFYPPNVKGWDGGKSWINTATLSFRYTFGRQLVTGRRPPQAYPAEEKTISVLPLQNLIDETDRRSPRQLVGKLCDLIYASNPAAELQEAFLPLVSGQPVPLSDQAVRELVALMLETPHYQLC